MKKLIYTLSTLLAALTLGSCSSEGIDRFDTDYKALNIWFGSASVVSEQTTYNYSYTSGEKGITFYARITGTPTDYDRTFTLEAYEGDITEAGSSYRVEDYVIPAGETTGTFTIYFDSSKLPSESSFAEEGELYFRVKANDEFSTGADGLNTLHVILRNYLSKPDDWDSASYPYRAYSYYFGSYSKTKYRFMIEETGLIDFRINLTTSTPYDATENIISTAYASYLKQVMQIALDEYNNTHDTPLTDENGDLVTF
jgi:hypothetical protein